jgi:hypothetical protein
MPVYATKPGRAMKRRRGSKRGPALSETTQAALPGIGPIWLFEPAGTVARRGAALRRLNNPTRVVAMHRPQRSRCGEILLGTDICQGGVSDAQ